MKWSLSIAACITLLILALMFWNTSPEQASPPVHTATTSAHADDLDTAPPASINPNRPKTARSVHLQGLDQTLDIDSKGNLITGPEVRELFDTIARQQGPIAADEWKQSILDQYANQLGPRAHQQLQTLLNRYIEFNLALQLLPMEGVASLNDALQRVQQIRDDYLGPDSANLFSDWQEMETFTSQFVQQMVNTQDPIQLKQSLQEQIYSLPVTVQPQAQKVLQHSEDLFTALATSRPDPATLKSVAEQMAARALVQPDFVFGEPSPAFMNQYQQYSRARQTLMQQGGVTSEDDPQLNQLRQQYFSGSEVLRVKTLDRAEMY